MLKVSRYCFLLAVAGCLLLAQPLMAAEGIKGNLVNVNWLEKNLKNADVLMLDASPTQIYTAKHIPGAVSVDLFTYGLPDTPVADMEKRFQSWGISPGKKIVMYDQGGGMMATKLFHSLYYHGFPAKDLGIRLSFFAAKYFPSPSARNRCLPSRKNDIPDLVSKSKSRKLA